MSRLDNFLKHYVDNYLNYDLSFMEQNDSDGRGVGFPLLMTCCAAIEFLGALRSTKRFKAHSNGSQYFRDYWQNYLYPSPSPHFGFHSQVYQLIRHGIAHTYFIKGSILVVRGFPNAHFTINADGLLVIDAVQLSQDLWNSYKTKVKPALTDPSLLADRVNMEARLSEIESDFAAQAQNPSLAAPDKTPPTPNGPVGFVSEGLGGGSQPQGPTGPLPPQSATQV